MGRRNELPSLLLLPFPPNPPSRHALNAAYRPSLAAVLSRLKNPNGQAKLLVAVVCPLLDGQFSSRSKSFSWAQAQSLVAGIYTIISVICSRLGIATEYDGGANSVEVSVILIDHDRKRRFKDQDVRPTMDSNNTVMVDLPTFATAYYPWNDIYHVGCEMGEQICSDFLRFAECKQTLLQEQLIAVDGGITMHLSSSGASEATRRTKGHAVVCLGGTFDHLHAGHKLLLTAGALLLGVPTKDSPQPCRFVIGVTGDELLKQKKFADQVQSWDDRARCVIQFLSSLLTLSARGWRDVSSPVIRETQGDLRASFRDGTIEVQCVEIQDAFGPTITVRDIDVLVVSGETRSGGQAVNDRRVQLGFHALEVHEVDVLGAEEIDHHETTAEDFASKISSTAIRKQRAEARNGVLDT